MELRQATTENHSAVAAGLPELGSTAAAGPYLVLMPVILKKPNVFGRSTAHFSELQQAK
jgi:hypothetical protein